MLTPVLFRDFCRNPIKSRILSGSVAQIHCQLYNLCQTDLLRASATAWHSSQPECCINWGIQWQGYYCSLPGEITVRHRIICISLKRYFWKWSGMHLGRRKRTNNQSFSFLTYFFSNPMALWHWGTCFSWHGSDEMMVELDNLRGFFQPWWLYNFMIQRNTYISFFLQ